MGRPAVLRVDIVTDAKGVSRGTSQAESKLSRFGSTAGRVGKAAALGLAGAGVAAVGLAVGCIKAAEAGRATDNRVKNVTRSMGLFGKSADKVSNRLLNLADKQARQLGIDDEVIKNTQAKLLTFGQLAKSADKVGGAFDRATQAAIDMAADGFGTAEGNAVQLGKALNDPIKGITALNKSGITFTETEKARIQTLVESNRMGQAQAMILKAVETQVGGTAAATATGSARMKVAFGQLQENIGNKLLPVFDKLTAFVLDDVMPAASRLGTQLNQKLGPTFKAIGQVVKRDVIPFLKGLANFVKDQLVPAFLSYAKPVIDGVRSAFKSFGQAIEDNRPQLEQILRVLGKVVGFLAKTLLPIIGNVIKLGFKALGLEIKIVVGIIGGLVKGIDKVVGAFKTVFGWIGKVADKLAILKPPGWLSKVPGLGWLGAADTLAIGRPALTGGAPGFGGFGGMATAALALGSWSSSSSSGPGLPGTWSPVIVDRRDLSTTVHVDGALDPVAVADQLERILNGHAVRLGRVTAYGPGR